MAHFGKSLTTTRTKTTGLQLRLIKWWCCNERCWLADPYESPKIIQFMRQFVAQTQNSARCARIFVGKGEAPFRPQRPKCELMTVTRRSRTLWSQVAVTLKSVSMAASVDERLSGTVFQPSGMRVVCVFAVWGLLDNRDEIRVIGRD